VSVGVVDLADAAALDLGAELLGSKGAGLAAMTRLGLPVPLGFVVTTEVGRAFLRDGEIPPEVRAAIRDGVRRLERKTGRRLGDPRAPLLVSVRSGATVSMPGMMSTVLNVGAIAVVPFDAEHPSRFELDTRRRFQRNYATTVLGLDEEPFAALEGPRRAARHTDDRRRLEELVRGSGEIVAASGRAIPDDAREQLEAAVLAVLASWMSPRAQVYRELHGVPDELGTAVIVQAMVFGNRDETSATGVAFSRDPTTGEPKPYGDVLFTAQGEDVVAGREPTDRLSALAGELPDVWDQLLLAMSTLEGHLRDMCYVEFTIESGRLWLLQVRPGGCTDRAAVRVAVDLADEGLISRADAIRRVTPAQVGVSTVTAIRTGEATRVVATGLGASPGVATGRIATTSEEAIHLAKTGPVILVRPMTSPIDMHGIAAADGILTSTGGLASHADVVARSMAKPAVVGASDVDIDTAAGTVTVGRTVLRTGDVLSIDGSSGTVVAGDVQTSHPQPDRHLKRLLCWSDAIAGTQHHESHEQRI